MLKRKVEELEMAPVHQLPCCGAQFKTIQNCVSHVPVTCKWFELEATTWLRTENYMWFRFIDSSGRVSVSRGVVHELGYNAGGLVPVCSGEESLS